MRWMPALGWAPTDFWAASLKEFFSAIDGYNEMHGAYTAAPAVSRDDLERLKQEHG